MLRGSAVAIVVATFIAAGALGATAIRGRADTHQDSTAVAANTASRTSTTVAGAPVKPAAPSAAPTHADPLPLTADSGARAIAHAPDPALTRVAEGAHGTLASILPAGQSDLGDGVTATRGDTDVTVAFDTPLARTRRPEKFERFVRNTLPMIYGSSVRGLLESIPEGSIAGQGDLLTVLPARGVRIPIDSSLSIRLFPETRPGQDGPLVIRYRVFVGHQ
jgi:hypothetical protein